MMKACRLLSFECMGAISFFEGKGHAGRKLGNWTFNIQDQVCLVNDFTDNPNLQPKQLSAKAEQLFDFFIERYRLICNDIMKRP